MEASIKEGNIKNFVRLLQCASRFGDELNMHANRDMWELAVTNSTKSAYCLFKLKPSFFCRFKALGDTTVSRRRGVKCQLLVKSVLAVLGKASSVANVERLDLTIVDPEKSLARKRKRNESEVLDDSEHNNEDSEDELQQGIAAKLVMKLVCKHGVTKKHSLHLGTSHFLRVDVDPDSTPSSFSVSARSLRDMIDHFSFATPGLPNSNGIRGDHQLGWMFAGGEVRMKSWETGQTSLSTEIKLDPTGEFVNYWLEGGRVDLTVPMKEFRAALTLAEQLGIQLLVAFSRPSQPLTIIGPVDDEGAVISDQYEIFGAIATKECEAFKEVRGSLDRDQTPTRSVTDTTAQHSTSRAHSQGPRGRPRLSMSTATRSQVTHIVLEADSSRERAHNEEPLFLPVGEGSQSEERRVDGQVTASQSVRIAMTESEAMRMSGLEDMTAQDVWDALDDAEDEDQREEMNTQERIQGQSGMVMDGTIENISGIIQHDRVKDFAIDFASPEHGLFGRGEDQATEAVATPKTPKNGVEKTGEDDLLSDEEMEESQQHVTPSKKFNPLFTD